MICKQCGCSTRMSDKNYKQYNPDIEFVYCSDCYKKVRKELIKTIEGLV